MLGDFLLDFYREVKVPYQIDGEEKNRFFYVKGISLRDLGELFSDEDTGGVLLKAIEGIDLKKDDEKVVKKAFVSLIDTNYSLAVYKIIARCLYIKNENGEYINCKDDYYLLDKMPFHITVKFLTHIIELSLPQDENSLRTEIKKLLSLLTIQKSQKKEESIKK